MRTTRTRRRRPRGCSRTARAHAAIYHHETEGCGLYDGCTPHGTDAWGATYHLNA